VTEGEGTRDSAYLREKKRGKAVRGQKREEGREKRELTREDRGGKRERVGFNWERD
jgi:hypothetical protein